MILPELRQLQQALDRKADAVQHAFSDTSTALHQVARRLIEARGVDEAPILRSRQRLASSSRRWRPR
jgi:hypothetical protein